MVRTGILRVFGASLRQVLARSIRNRFKALVSGLGVTALVQSSTATSLIVSSFVGQGLVSLPLALAVMLGADIGTSLMAVVFAFDLSWLSPLSIFLGVVLFIARPGTDVGRFGRILIGLGLMLLALRLVTDSAAVLTQSAAVRGLLASLGSDLLLEITVGACLAVLSYSSLATVLLTATLAGSNVIPLDVALGSTTARRAAREAHTRAPSHQPRPRARTCAVAPTGHGPSAQPDRAHRNVCAISTPHQHTPRPAWRSRCSGRPQPPTTRSGPEQRPSAVRSATTPDPQEPCGPPRTTEPRTASNETRRPPRHPGQDRTSSYTDVLIGRTTSATAQKFVER